MITITNIMHVNGSKADLYSSNYFKKVEGVRDAISPFARWTDGSIVAFGTKTNELGTVNIAIDLSQVVETLFPFELGDDPMTEISEQLSANESLLESAYITSPLIPHSKSFTDWMGESLGTARTQRKGEVPTLP